MHTSRFRSRALARLGLGGLLVAVAAVFATLGARLPRVEPSAQAAEARVSPSEISSSARALTAPSAPATPTRGHAGPRSICSAPVACTDGGGGYRFCTEASAARGPSGRFTTDDGHAFACAPGGDCERATAALAAWCATRAATRPSG